MKKENKKETMVMTVGTIATLKNKELKSNLKALISAIESGRKASWQFAYAINDIVSKEQFKDDFKNYDAFAKYIGMSKASISNQLGAVRFLNQEGLVILNEKGNVDYSRIYIGVYNAYILSTLTENEYKEFEKWAEEQEINILSLSQAKLKALLKKWKDSIIDGDAEVIEESTEEASEESTEEASEESTEERERAITAIIGMMKKYDITVQELKEAIKK